MSKLDTAERKRFQTRIDAIRGLYPLSEIERYNYDLRNVEVGGYFALAGENWQVTAIHRYRETKWNFNKDKSYQQWELEILSLKTAEVRHIEWGVDDALEISLTQERLKFRDLADEDGQKIGKSDLDRIADQEGGVTYNGKTYWYEDDESWAAKFYRDRGEHPERVRFYEFESEDGNCLTIEVWYEGDDRECAIWTSKEVKPNAIQVLQLRAAEAA